MAKKHKQEEAPAGSPAWMATFSDLMNLLLCFFVLLFSMSSTDAAKYDDLSKSLSEAFSIFNGGGSSIGDGQMISAGATQLNELDEYFNDMGKASQSDTEADDPLKEYQEQLEEEKRENTEKLYEDVVDAAEEANISDYVNVNMGSGVVHISISGGLLFESAKADLRKDVIPIVNKIGDILKQYDKHRIQILGHTDNVPISNGEYRNNMELSSARAIAVWQYLIDKKGLDPASLEACGKGEYDPVASNKTASGRAKNRRVEIDIYTLDETD